MTGWDERPMTRTVYKRLTRAWKCSVVHMNDLMCAMNFQWLMFCYHATAKKLYSINKLGYILFLMQPHSTNMLQNSWTHCTRCAHSFWPRGKPSSLVVCVSRHSHKLEALRILSSKHLRHMASMFTTMGIRPRNLTGLSLESSSAGFGWDGTRSIHSPNCSSMEHTGRMMRFM